MAWPLILGAGIAATAATLQMAGNLMSNKENVEMQKETNAMQMDQFNKQMDYTKSTQAEQWRRDDTMLQRSVADAQAAGLSPLTAAGLGNTSTVVAQPAPPHLQAPHVDSIMSGVNMDSLIDTLIQSKRLDLEEKKYLTEDENRDLDRQAELDMTAQKLDVQVDIFKKQEDNKMAMFTANLSHLIRVQDWDEKMDYQKAMMDEMDKFQKDALGKSHGATTNYKVYDDKDKYESAMQSWANRFDAFLAIYVQTPSKMSESHGFNMGANAGANIGGSSGSTGSAWDRSGGTSGGQSGSGLAGANAGYNTGKNDSWSFDATQDRQMRLAQWFAKNPVPVYRPYKKVM